MKNYLITGIINGLLILSINSSGQQSKPDFPLKNGVLLFNSGFEPGSRIVHGSNPFTSDDKIAGKDLSVTPPNDWIEDFKKSPNLGNFSFQYQGADTTKRIARIIPEPGNPDNHVLLFRINEPWANAKGHNLARIQANIYEAPDKEVKGIKVFYQKVRIFLHEDMEILRSYPLRIHWLTIMEVWNNHTWGDDPYPFRIAVGMGKPSSVKEGLFFKVGAQDYAYRTDSIRGGYTTLWDEMNTNIEIPFGKWVTLEYFINEGNVQSGHFYMTMTPEGGEKTVVFDIRNFTHNTKDPDPQGITLWNPMKLYTSRDLVNFVKSEGKSLQIYFDDFEFWKDRVPFK